MHDHPPGPMRVADLRFAELFRAQEHDGRVFFNNRRAVLLDVEALGILRQQLIDTLGDELAMGLLIRFGFAHGHSDARMLGQRFPWASEVDWLAAGPALHTLEGIVHVTPTRIEFDRESGHFHMEAAWLNSFEAEQHLARQGPGHDPVCWILAGYAAGYCSCFFGRDLVAVETECVGRGDARCYVDVRPAGSWGVEAAPYLKAQKAVDVTRQLHLSGVRFRDMALSYADWMWETDEQGRYTYCSEHVTQVLGLGPEQVVGRSLVERVPAAEAERVATAFARAVQTRTPLDGLECAVHDADGRLVFLSIDGVPVVDGAGKVTGLRGVVKDVTERRGLADATEERLRLAELGRDINAALNGRGSLRDMLQACTDVMNRLLAPASARIWTLANDDQALDLQASSGTWEDDHEAARVVRIPLIFEGRQVGVLAIASQAPPGEHARKALETVAGNIAIALENRGHEDSLRVGEARFRMLSQEFNAILDALPDTVTLQGKDHKILWTNRAVAARLGSSSIDLVGLGCSAIWKCPLSCEACPIGLSLRTGLPQNALLHGEDGRIWDVRTVPMRGGGDEVDSVMAIGRDITAQQQMEEQFRHVQKMQAVGTLAGGFAHDFNNMLAPIIGYADIGLEQLPPDSPVRKNLAEILIAANRARDLVRQILTLSPMGETVQTPVRLQAIVEQVVLALKSSLPANIAIEQDIDPDCPAVLVDPTHMHQVLINLCTNAGQAMTPGGGVLRLILTYDEAPAGARTPPGGDSAPRFVRLDVSDTGPGIDPGLVGRIFEPYFTTRPKGEGSGLGLSVVHGVVERHGGRVTVDSRPGLGTTFHVVMPVADRPSHHRDAPLPAVVPKGTERILLVDDEVQFVALTRLLLEALGYRVDAFTDSLEAWQAFLEQPAAYDLVITDQNMPNLTGMELAERALAIRPDVPLLLVTGYSEVTTEGRARAAGIREFLMKPFRQRDLARAVRGALDGLGKPSAG